MTRTASSLLSRKLAAAIVVAACAISLHARADEGVAARVDPIVNGHPSVASEEFGTVAILDLVTGQIFCTGTLVTPRVVVTAAHCLFEGTMRVLPQQIEVAFGVLDVTAEPPPEHLVGVVSAVPHPDYASNTRSDTLPDGLDPTNGDIAYLVLAHELLGVPTVPLASESQAAHVGAGSVVTISGFGTTSDVADDVGVLRTTLATIGSRVSREFIAQPLDATQGDACFGDSGGPAYAFVDGTPVLLGVTSRGREDVAALCGEGGIWTSATPYGGWLRTMSGDDRIAPVVTHPGGCAIARSAGRPGLPVMSALVGLGFVVLLRGRRRTRALTAW